VGPARPAPPNSDARCEHSGVASEPIDLLHLGHERVIGVYPVETPDGLALFDCGPRTCVDALEAGLLARGVAPTDLRHLLISHIHLDHAGAAGTLVRRHPHIQVHVSDIGAPHLVDPSRLGSSARRLYGDELDRLWGEPEPVPARNVHPTESRVLGVECFPAPGHASHHVCYLAEDGTLYAGDAAGVRITPARHVVPQAPPPDIDLAGWERTFAELERRAPGALALTHFGVVEEVGEHIDEARSRLRTWADRIRAGMGEEEWLAEARAELVADEGPAVAEQTERAATLRQSYAGIRRYLDKSATARRSIAAR
jgi:glyoxylase-like metal-dependent hydrolase (beta-lactamase superfamily II)